MIYIIIITCSIVFSVYLKDLLERYKFKKMIEARRKQNGNYIKVRLKDIK